jgi:hypothetical protein
LVRVAPVRQYGRRMGFRILDNLRWTGETVGTWVFDKTDVGASVATQAAGRGTGLVALVRLLTIMA